MYLWGKWKSHFKRTKSVHVLKYKLFSLVVERVTQEISANIWLRAYKISFKQLKYMSFTNKILLCQFIYILNVVLVFC